MESNETTKINEQNNKLDTNANNTNLSVLKCNKTGCTNDGKLRCPECVKLKIKEESYFCGKDCFKSYWGEHKSIHEECRVLITYFYYNRRTHR